MPSPVAFARSCYCSTPSLLDHSRVASTVCDSTDLPLSFDDAGIWPLGKRAATTRAMTRAACAQERLTLTPNPSPPAPTQWTWTRTRKRCCQRRVPGR
jgi:hypothetical protein